MVELAQCAEERGVKIMGVQEHRRVHADDPIMYRRGGGYLFITSSAWQNEAQAATGVGGVRPYSGFSITLRGSLSQQ